MAFIETDSAVQALLLASAKAALSAGEIIRAYYQQQIDVYSKKDESPFTKADLEANAIIMKALAKHGFPMITEEAENQEYSTRKHWDYCWIIDPLDGTREFIQQTGEFTVNIALVKNGKPLLGCIYAPVLDSLYLGWVGKGAWKQSHASVFLPEELIAFQSLPLHALSPTPALLASRLNFDEKTQNLVAKVKQHWAQSSLVNIGSSLKFCYLAEGIGNVYPRFSPTMEWDTAAGQALVEAVGGCVWEWGSQKSLVYNRENMMNGGFLALAPNFMDQCKLFYE